MLAIFKIEFYVIYWFIIYRYMHIVIQIGQYYCFHFLYEKQKKELFAACLVLMFGLAVYL